MDKAIDCWGFTGLDTDYYRAMCEREGYSVSAYKACESKISIFVITHKPWSYADANALVTKSIHVN